MALWHHVGATIGITLDKNGSLYDPTGTESCDMQVRLVKYFYIYIYINGTMEATSCDLNAPRYTTTVPLVRFHRSRGGVFVDHRPPGTPVIPSHIYNII